MIYTLTLNPAVDYSMCISSISEGQTNRSQGESILFGGKGINVSCVLKNLGVNSMALGFIAGFTGDALEASLKEKEIDTDFVRLESGFTRINVKLKGKSETEINASGPNIDESALSQLFSKLFALKSGDTLVLSGSVPASLSNDIYADIMGALYPKNIKFAVDASGELLLKTLKYKPFIIKPNLAELEGICNKSLRTQNAIIKAARELIQKGAQNVLVSMGKKGAILVCDSGEVFIQKGHKGKAINSVGAGDSTLAAFLYAEEKGFEYALEFANAAGAACAFSQNLPNYEQIKQLMLNK